MEAISLLITIDEDDFLSKEKEQQRLQHKQLDEMPEFDDLFGQQNDSSLSYDEQNALGFDISKLLQHY